MSSIRDQTSSALLVDPLVLSDSQQEIFIILCAVISIIFGVYNVFRVLSIKVHSYGKGEIELQDTGTTSDKAIEH